MVRAEYIKRYIKEKKFQKKVFGMVLDWTIVTYLVIPIIIALGVIDYRLWQSPPAWTSIIPVELFSLCLFVITIFFSMRTYIEQADELFVIQNIKFYNTLIQRGKYWAVLKSVFETGAVMLYILPIFSIGYHLSSQSLLAIYFFVFLWSLYHKLIARWFFLRRIIWRRRIFSFLAFVLYGIGIYCIFNSPVIFISITLLIFITVLFLLKREKLPIRYFHAEADFERNEKWKWASQIMLQSGEFEGIQKTRKYPLLNKSSRPIFSERTPEKVLTEMYWKWHIRKWRQLKYYLYFISVAFYATAILPLKIKFWVLAFIILAGYKIQESIWKTFITHPFTKIIGTLNEISIMKAKRTALMVSLLIPFGLLTILTVTLFL